MAYRILLENPPIYDFAAYDFWLKPYGMLSGAGNLRGSTCLHLSVSQARVFVEKTNVLMCDQNTTNYFNFFWRRTNYV